MNQKANWGVVPAVLLVVAFLVRAWGLADVGLWHDEAISHFYATQSPAWIIRNCAGFINHPPLFFLLLRGWMSVVSPFDQFAVELMNVFVGTGTVGVLLLWAYRLLSRRMAIIAGWLMALSPFHIYYSGELRMYALATLGFTCSCYFATRILQGDRHVRHFVGWVLSCLVALYSHSFTGIPIFFMLLYLGVESVRRDWFKSYLVATSAVLVGYAPWFWVVYAQAVDVASDYWLPAFQWRYLVNLFGILGGWIGPRANSVMAVVALVCLTVGFLLPWGYSIRRGVRSRSWVKLLWFMFFGTLLLVVGISLAGQSVFIYRPYVIFVPAILLLVGKGLSSWPRTWVVVAITLLVGFNALEAVQLKRNPPHQYAKDVANWVDREHSTDSVVVHLNRFSFFPSYFYHARRLPEYLMAADPSRSFSITRSRARQLNQTRELFVVFSRSRDTHIPEDWTERATWSGEKQWPSRHYRALKIPPVRSK